MTSPIPHNLVFYASPPHECSYLEERQAVTLFADPHAPMHTELYGALINVGFRRSGEYVYRPRCRTCDACRPARVPVERFSPDRAQRRAWRANADLSVRAVEPAFHDEYYELYRRYLSTRHRDGGMDVDEPERFMEFLGSSWCRTEFVEFRAGNRLVAVAVTDLLPEGLSAVYTFFDPAEARRGLGTYAVLWQIEAARRHGLHWLYLGYWIKESPKMAYKGRFRPLEIMRGGRWIPATESARMV